MSDSFQNKRNNPQIDFLLDALNDSKDAVSVLTIAWHSDGKYHIYMHGSPVEIAFAMKTCGQLDDVITHCNLIDVNDSDLRTD